MIESIKNVKDLPLDKGNTILYEIWSEGFVVQGNSSGAIYHGSEYARTFKEACNKLSKKSLEFNRYYDPEDMTFWGCRLFDNESEARESFG